MSTSVGTPNWTNKTILTGDSLHVYPLAGSLAVAQGGTPT